MWYIFHRFRIPANAESWQPENTPRRQLLRNEHLRLIRVFLKIARILKRLIDGCHNLIIMTVIYCDVDKIRCSQLWFLNLRNKIIKICLIFLDSCVREWIGSSFYQIFAIRAKYLVFCDTHFECGIFWGATSKGIYLCQFTNLSRDFRKCLG